MGKYAKLRERILSGASDGNIDFASLQQLLMRLGFTERIRGDHHIFTRPDIQELINLQPKAGKAKPYQVRQIRDLMIQYRLGASDVDQI